MIYRIPHVCAKCCAASVINHEVPRHTLWNDMAISRHTAAATYRKPSETHGLLSFSLWVGEFDEDPCAISFVMSREQAQVTMRVLQECARDIEKAIAEEAP